MPIRRDKNGRFTSGGSAGGSARRNVAAVRGGAKGTLIKPGGQVPGSAASKAGGARGRALSANVGRAQSKDRAAIQAHNTKSSNELAQTKTRAGRARVNQRLLEERRTLLKPSATQSRQAPTSKAANARTARDFTSSKPGSVQRLKASASKSPSAKTPVSVGATPRLAAGARGRAADARDARIVRSRRVADRKADDKKRTARNVKRAEFAGSQTVAGLSRSYMNRKKRG